MSLPAATQSTVAVPRIEVRDGLDIRVLRWGTVLGHVLRPGDRIVPGDPSSALVVLVPRGRGRPMLAARCGARLLALPGRVPASTVRWRVLCGVAAIQRDLERGAPVGGQLHVATRVLSNGAATSAVDHSFDAPTGPVDGRALDALCVRAALAPRRGGPSVAVAVATSPALAAQLLQDTPAGCLRFALDATDAQEGLGTVIAGPWPGSQHDGSRARGGMSAGVAAQGWDRQDGEATGSSAPQVPLPFRADTRSSA